MFWFWKKKSKYISLEQAIENNKKMTPAQQKEHTKQANIAGHVAVIRLLKARAIKKAVKKTATKKRRKTTATKRRKTTRKAKTTYNCNEKKNTWLFSFFYNQ